MKKLLSTLSVLAFASTLALAEDKPAAPPPPPGGPGGPEGRPRPNPEEIFKRLDTNGDGTISLEEFKASPRAQKDPAKAEEIYKKMDKAGDGKVTLEEFKAARPPHEGGPGKHGPGGPGSPGGPDKGAPAEKPADPK